MHGFVFVVLWLVEGLKNTITKIQTSSGVKSVFIINKLLCSYECVDGYLGNHPWASQKAIPIVFQNVGILQLPAHVSSYDTWLWRGP